MLRISNFAKGRAVRKYGIIGRMKSRFTLMEMLVVIAIIGILAALIVGTMLHATAGATRTSCMNNLKQISAGLNIYVQQNNFYLPYCTMTPSAPPLGEEGMPGIAETLRTACGGDTQVFCCPADEGRTYFTREGSSYEWQTVLNINGKLLDKQSLKLLGHDRYVLMDYDNFHNDNAGNGKSGKNYLYSDGRVTDKVE